MTVFWTVLKIGGRLEMPLAPLYQQKLIPEKTRQVVPKGPASFMPRLKRTLFEVQIISYVSGDRIRGYVF